MVCLRSARAAVRAPAGVIELAGDTQNRDLKIRSIYERRNCGHRTGRFFNSVALQAKKTARGMISTQRDSGLFH